MPKQGNILIVDDNQSILDALDMLLRLRFAKVDTLLNPKRLISFLKSEEVDVVLLDMNFTSGVNNGNEGLYWLQEILKVNPAIQVIMITAYGDVKLAVKALKLGAADFILKPWENDKLMSAISDNLKLKRSKHLTENAIIKTSVNNTTDQELIGDSDAIKEMIRIIDKVAVTDANVLITGENGTGKELIARQIHQKSTRGHKPMVGVDLGALNDNLFESELFGHQKGSFTDAVADRQGKFEAAQGGTLFLDEIGNLPLNSQSTLLAAIQNREITPVGSNDRIQVDIRLVCATNASLDQMVERDEFREDLLYRVNTIEIKVPPLRDRGTDIKLLADYFLDHFKNRYKKGTMVFNQTTYEKLMSYHWPGNIRELAHMIEKAVILTDQRTLNPGDFDFKLSAPLPVTDQAQTLSEMEKLMIINVIDKHQGNLSSTAEELGVTRQTLYNKIKKYRLEENVDRNGY